MSDEREPPPMNDLDDAQDQDDDDLFADAREVPKTPEVVTENPLPVPASRPTKKAAEEKNPLDDVESEITLESDEEEKKEPAAKEPSSLFDDKPVAAAREPEKPSVKPSEPPSMGVSQSSTASSKASAMTTKEEIEEEKSDDKFMINISVTEPKRIGDGMSAYIAYKVITKTTIPSYRKPEFSVMRRFSDFLGLHGKLAEKHVHLGRIVPPAPEKSVLGMTKVKWSKEESGSTEFIERRRSALERFLNRSSIHPVLRIDPDFRDFIETEGDLPKSTSTSALSGAGVMRLFHKVGDAMEKIAFKMDETDEWFEEKQQQTEALDQQLRKLHANMEILVQHRRELSICTASFAKSAAMLGNAEEHTALSRALSQLAETEEKIEVLHRDQADNDFYIMAELLKDYIMLLGSVKDVFHERVKSYKIWKDAETTLNKKRETKAKFELAHKTDKIQQAQTEVTEWENKVEKGQVDFERISDTIKKEVVRFDNQRIHDFKASVLKYLELLMEGQQKVIKYWETFLPEAKAIA